MPAGIITSSNFAKALYPGVSSWYGKEYDEWMTEYDKLFDTYKSNRAYEEDVGISSFGLAQIKAEGEGIEYDDESQAFTTRYTHVVPALGFIITREMVEDDLYDVVGEKRARALAFSARQTKEVIGSNVYNRAFSGSYVGGDGVSMINASHPNYAGGTWSNTLGTAADLSEASLEEACIDIQKFTDDRGLRISVIPQSLHIPVDLQFEAERILKTQFRVGTNDNDINALWHLGKFPKGIFVNHYLSDPDAWFIRTNVKNGMKYYERRADEFTTDNDFDTENAKFKYSGRYSFGWTDPRAIYGSPGA